ncbi:MAG TPA: metalloprotease TldD [Candidatus Thiothrix moscowensis]|uniref:metalloprotease TldD n=1 Tax=unclassified Thiothrix TaxID=2636184 RepID=UPI0025CFCC11|nr:MULTISPECIES: metalloprotease TldD [unclassified Thiothrix]HRJ53570.1 metalloprotease TldD [Candidatus Thiothrix moscowensis]HRJ93622.1 metalloprotease TldD [Candidatus Thiothrix moscowensis]
MKQAIELARETFLTSTGLSDQHLEQVFSHLLRQDTTLADLYFQSARYESWGLEEGIIKSGSYSIEQGVGVRAVCGEQTGFAYSGEISLPALLESARAASAISRAGQSGSVNAWKVNAPSRALYGMDDPLASLSESDKIAFLQQIDSIARATSPYVQQVMANMVAVHEIILIVDESGRMTADVRPLVRTNVSVIVERNGQTESATAGGGGRFNLDFFTNGNKAQEYAEEAVRKALINLDAEAAPAGSMTVVLGNGWPGVLLHEAIGHGLEGDFNRKGTSAFAGRIGEQVAAKGITVVDDGTLSQRRGSLSVDDEGTETQCTTLIEDGILKGYLFDRQNAALMNTRSTGNGRRQSYAHLPMPRMTNTYMQAGNYAAEEIIASVDKGIYAVNFSGGQVDITSGKFVFSASEAYVIENGKLGKPLKNATLIGNGPDVLTRVSMVGNDLQLDTGIGVCGKDGQSVPVGVGQPTLRVDGLTVGGTATA